jgi:hypothetical protein
LSYRKRAAWSKERSSVWDAWRALLPRQSVVLVPFRNPHAVVDSFERYGLERQRAGALWLQLNRLALQAAASGPFESVFLDFDDRELFALRLGGVLGPYVETYDPALRHEAPRTASLQVAFRELYDELRLRIQC